MNILINIIIQIVIFILSIYIVGFIISKINSLFYKIVGESNVTCHITGIIGTPIHELSHALFCVIFLHKIEEIKLFEINSEDGTLGYVRHSYNKKNIYKVIGNFFIGVAPIIVGTTILTLLLWLMIPTTFKNIMDNIDLFVVKTINGFNINSFLELIYNIFVSFFKGANNWMWWLYLLICLFIALHMNFSVPDFKGSLGALPFIILIIVIINLILGFIFKSIYPKYIQITWIAGSYLISMLLLSLLFSLVTIIFAIVIRLFLKIVKKS